MSVDQTGYERPALGLDDGRFADRPDFGSEIDDPVTCDEDVVDA